MPQPLIGLPTERIPAYSTFAQGVLETYITALMQAGGVPVLLPTALTGAAMLTAYGRLDGVLLPGGGDIDPARYAASAHPATCEVDVARDQLEIDLTRTLVQANDKPVLGVCRGAQLMNVALGGTLYQDLPTEYPGALAHQTNLQEFARDHLSHPVEVQAGSRLAGLLGTTTVQVNSRHHQAIRQVAPGLHAVAHAPDGVIEGLELPTHRFAVAVQWHPENLQAQPEMKRLFEQFVQACLP